MSNLPFLPYCRHVVEDDDIQAVVAVLKGEALTCGPMIPRFESELASVTGAAHAVVCSSGTAALHLAALALDLRPGDAVLVPAQTFAATANCIRYVGAEVIFTDVDPDSGLMRPQDMEAALARHPHASVRAVFPVHINGQTADMAVLGAMAAKRGLAVVEDVCHALGTQVDGFGPAGNCAHSLMSCFSFHPAKTIAMGEGGAVTTNDPKLARQLELLRTHGITRDPDLFMVPGEALDTDGAANPWYYEMIDLGFNYRATDFQCALGLSQLAKLPRFARIRRDLVDAYARLLAPLSPVVKPVARRAGQNPVWHLAAVLVDYDQVGKSRSQVMRELRERGVGTQVNYIPVHWQPYYRSLAGGHPPSLPGAESYYHRCLSLPLSATMNIADVERVVDALRGVLSA